MPRCGRPGLRRGVAVLLRRWAAAAGLCAALMPCAAAGTKQIAITIDDVPVASTTPVSLAEVVDINNALLRVLKQHGVPAIGFVNEDKLYRRGEVDARIDILRAWLDAGMELGNHNFGHLGLWSSALADVQDAVIKGEAVTRKLTAERGAPLRFYRPPYTQTGRDEAQKAVFESFLAAHGYRVAPFTMEHDDYLYSCVYDRSPAEPERLRLIAAYMRHLQESVEVFESMSQQLFGRQVPQIFLLHANRLNGRTLDATLQALKAAGYQFISLDQALSDPAYRSAEQASGRFGLSWLARWARASKTRLTVYGQPDPVGWAADQAQALCNDAAASEH